MLYAIIIHGEEAEVDGWSKEQEETIMGRHAALREDFTATGRLGPSVRLGPALATKKLRGRPASDITDGPFAETKEQLLGLYVVDCDSPGDAIAAAERLSFDTAVIEVRPIAVFLPGNLVVS